MTAETPAVPTDEQAKLAAKPFAALHDLDPSLYNPTPESTEFLKSITGIVDDEELKEHIFAIQSEAWKTVKYICIRSFGFMHFNIARHFAYPDLLQLGRERPDAIFLEFASCFGNDLRKVVLDGFPISNVIAADVEPIFWDLGNKLFKTNKESFPVPYVNGSVFDESFIPRLPPLRTGEETPTTRQPLHNLDGSPVEFTSLAPLRGHISAIHASAFFHLFSESEQLTAAQALGSLLSPEPGSFLFGSQLGNVVAGERKNSNLRGKVIYDHSPESWKELWDGVIFPKGTVEVKTNLFEINRGVDGKKKVTEKDMGDIYYLYWSVKRL